MCNIRKMSNRARAKSGLTLIEMLVVMVILSVISLALYATFNNGVKVWQRVSKQIPEADVSIAFEKFGIDIRNCLKFGSINFNGAEDGLRLAALVDSPGLNSRSVGEITYFYDKDKRTLNRELRDYSQIYTAEDGSTEKLLANVSALKFQYYLYIKERKEYIWENEWARPDLPLAVRLELDFDNGSQVNKFIKTVSIPVSG